MNRQTRSLSFGPETFAPWQPTEPIIRRRETVTGFTIPRFGWDVWDLSCIDDRENRDPVILDFSALPPALKRTAKELIVQRLNEPVPNIRRRRPARPMAAATCSITIVNLRWLFAFMADRGIAKVQDLTTKDIDHYKRAVLNLSCSPSYKHGRLKLIDMLYESREHLTDGGLRFHPWPGKRLMQMAGLTRPDENLTARMPEDVIGPLLNWALIYIDDFSSDIIGAARETIALRNKFSKTRPPLTRDEARSRLLAYHRSRIEEKRPIPALRWRGRIVPDLDLIALEAEVSRQDAERAHGMFSSRTGVTLSNHLLPASRVLDGLSAPWCDGFSRAEIEPEVERLQMACYVVCAYLSGMRDSEVQSLRVGCLEALRDEEGRIFRYKVKGITYKGSVAAEPRKWVVIEPVARAVRVLELIAELNPTPQAMCFEIDDETAILRITGAADARLLFSEPFGDYRGDARWRGKAAVTLRKFAKHCNDVLAPTLVGSRFTRLPEREDGPWHFHTRQFRRTLAWHIANRPFGIVAAMIQYGHANVQMTEGYAGTSEAGFLAEVEQERVVAALSDVIEMFRDDSAGIHPSGPMAEELSDFFKNKRREIGEFRGEAVDERRMMELFASKAATLHVGPLVHCFYKPEHARCQTSIIEAERRDPLVGLCDPDCGNAVWTKRNLGALRMFEKENGRYLGSRAVSGRQRSLIRSQQDRVKRMILAIETATVEDGRGQ